MRVLLIGVLLTGVLAGCASHSVRCEGPLQPINQRQTAREADAPAATAQRTAVP
jgi:hypothetical protein